MPVESGIKGTVFQEEKWTDVLPELLELFPAHWAELARFKEQIPMRVDTARYENLEKLGFLLVITARREGRLIGYFVAFLMAHPHYEGSGTWAMTDIYYVVPEFRTGAGLSLFRAFEDAARARGCSQIVTSCKIHEDHTALLEKLGWTWTDKTFQKHLGMREVEKFR